MNKIFIMCLLAFGSSQINTAQSKEDLEKIKTLKVAYFTEHLALSPEEAEKFWPIYNQHETVQIEMYSYMRKNMNHRILKAGELNESEAGDKLSEYLSKKSSEEASLQKMFQALKGVLPAKKALALVHVEEGFRRHLMSLYRKNRNEQRQEKEEEMPKL